MPFRQRSKVSDGIHTLRTGFRLFIDFQEGLRLIEADVFESETL